MNNRAIYTEDFFESYLRNELIPPEREAFENAMKDDVGLKADFEIHQKLFRGLEYQFEQNLKSKISASMNMVVDQDTETVAEKTATIRSFNYKPLAIAASLLLVASMWFLTQSNDNDGISDQLFALSEMETNLRSEMGFASDDKAIRDAFISDLDNLKKGKASDALNNLAPIEKDKVSHSEATMKYLFYKHLSMGDFEDARKYLNLLGQTSVDKEELQFLACVLEYNESNQENKDCLEFYSNGENKVFAKTAKSIIG